MSEAELQQRLAELAYPCYLVVYGPEHDRTRSERGYGHRFISGMVYTAGEAFELIKGTQYRGSLYEMQIIAIACIDGELTETVI